MKSKSWNSFYNSILPAVCFGALTGVLTSLAVNLYKACAKHVISFSEESYHFIGERLYLIPLVLGEMEQKVLNSSILRNWMPNNG